MPKRIFKATYILQREARKIFISQIYKNIKNNKIYI